MVWIDSTFLLFLIGWSIFVPFLCVLLGWYARGEEMGERRDVL